jgi:hypothetical protein
MAARTVRAKRYGAVIALQGFQGLLEHGLGADRESTAKCDCPTGVLILVSDVIPLMIDLEASELRVSRLAHARGAACNRTIR